MAITKNLVEKMGGTITFESKEGAGTTFVIRVPFQIDTDRCGQTVKTRRIKQKILSRDCIFFWQKIMS